MNTGKTIFTQVMSYIPKYEFDKCVKKYKGNYRVTKFSCWDQLLTMSFAQLTYRETLRDIEACLRAQPQKLYHMGIKGNPSRTNISKANKKRDWRIYAEYAQILIARAKDLHKDEPNIIEEIHGAIYALDSTTIDLCLSIFDWAKFRKTKAGIKLHTLLELKGSLPTFIEITNALSHDVNILDILITEPGAYYIMDRAYVDFERLYKIEKNLSYFIVRAKKNFSFQRIYSKKVDKSEGLRCDQIIKLTGNTTRYDYPGKLRRVKYYDKETNKLFVFLTNNFEIEPLTVAQLYKNRWQVELFFKWIKQHLRIKSFYGTTPNAVKTQIWIAIGVYVLISIIRKSLTINLKLYTILQILSVSLFEKVSILELLTDPKYNLTGHYSDNQLFLFDL
jgi:hypothetical protein